MEAMITDANVKGETIGSPLLCIILQFNLAEIIYTAVITAIRDNSIFRGLVCS